MRPKHNELPHDATAELAALSSMLMDSKAVDAAAKSLVPNDFCRVDYRAAYAAILALHKANQPIDLITLKAKLDEQGIFAKIGGVEFLGSIASDVSTSVNIRHYVQIVADKARRRRMITLGNDLMAAGHDETKSLDVFDELLNAGKEVMARTDDIDTKIYSSYMAMNDYMQNLDMPKKVITTGLPTLDKVSGGIKVPSVMMLGATPSTGKTSFALNIAAAQKTGSVIIFSLEMSREMIYDRLVSIMGGVDYGVFVKSQKDAQTKQRITQVCEAIESRPLYIFDDVYSIEEQMALVAQMGATLVIVDYIQKVRTSKKSDGRRDDIEHISGEYKRMANINNCVVMLLSQISRVDRGRPTMASLKESGALEADGDYVALLHRPYVLDKDGDKSPYETEFLLDKNKFGRTFKLDLHFEGKFQTFYEVDNNSKMPF